MLSIAEQLAALTDFVLFVFAVCWGASLLLTGTIEKQVQVSRTLWGAAFVCAAWAAFLGSWRHAVSDPEAILQLRPFIVSLVVCASLLFFVASAFAYTLRSIALLTVIAVSGTVVHLVAAIKQSDFGLLALPVIMMAIGTVAFQLLRWARGTPEDKRSARASVLGFVLAGTGVALWRLGIGVNAALDPNSVAHLVLLGAFYALYRGGRIMNDVHAGTKAAWPQRA